MNSDVQTNGMAIPSCSRPDDNANVDQSKGAIPKIRSSKRTPKKIPKTTNNNIQDTGRLNGRSLPRRNTYSSSDSDCEAYCSERNGLSHTTFRPRLQPRSYNSYESKKDTTDSTSDEENDLLSVSDDGCIYTYKGDDEPPENPIEIDLPAPEQPEVPARPAVSSPEMDFLEMDFDPGPSGDADSDSHGCTGNSPEGEIAQAAGVSEEKLVTQHVMPEKLPDVSVNFQWSCSTSRRRVRRVRKGIVPNGLLHTHFLPDNLDVEVFLWSEREAHAREQTSGGSVMAIANALEALGVPPPSTDAIRMSIGIRGRIDDRLLPEYLRGRSRAECDHRDLVRALETCSKGRIYARFFSMHPERCVDLRRWLAAWLRSGAIPILTLNSQVGKRSEDKWDILDGWQHRTVYGVDQRGIHTVDPLDCIGFDDARKQLMSESVLLVRVEDVVNKWNARRDTGKLKELSSKRWRELNVIGQIAKVIRESRRANKIGAVKTTHVKIPTDYKSGVTLAIDRNSPTYNLLRHCPELPLLDDVSYDVNSKSCYRFN